MDGDHRARVGLSVECLYVCHGILYSYVLYLKTLEWQKVAREEREGGVVAVILFVMEWVEGQEGCPRLRMGVGEGRGGEALISVVRCRMKVRGVVRCHQMET